MVRLLGLFDIYVIQYYSGENIKQYNDELFLNVVSVTFIFMNNKG